jgi:tRNA (cytidine/uridine-2'-O-)-methyltransferase
MFHVLLHQPEIPPNTGNIMRLCANTGVALHLIHPLGFSLEQRQLRRAGLDYRDLATVTEHDSLPAALAALNHPTVYAFSTRGTGPHTAPRYQPGDALLFGPETRGLPDDVLNALPAACRLRIPMREGSRSLNLSNAVAAVVYEAWRQHDFAGATAPTPPPPADVE